MVWERHMWSCLHGREMGTVGGMGFDNSDRREALMA